MRSGELYALTWGQVDLLLGRITIDRSFNGCSYEAPTKNFEIRVIPINPGLGRLLKELKLERGNEEFVLPRNKEWEYKKAASILRSFQKDIGVQETNFHSLRASYITHLLLKGVPITKVQYLVGHKDLKTTQRYVRLCGSDVLNAATSIDVDLDDILGAKVIPFKNSASEITQ